MCVDIYIYNYLYVKYKNITIPRDDSRHCAGDEPMPQRKFICCMPCIHSARLVTASGIFLSVHLAMYIRLSYTHGKARVVKVPPNLVHTLNQNIIETIMDWVFSCDMHKPLRLGKPYNKFPYCIEKLRSVWWTPWRNRIHLTILQNCPNQTALVHTRNSGSPTNKPIGHVETTPDLPEPCMNFLKKSVCSSQLNQCRDKKWKLAGT